ncbi:DNA damage-inducible protein I [Escherichia coli]|uniref:DNA damage-inducible protein I n=1 Tax=Escherichia coli TaxID=562 RepID=UPI003D65076C
MRIEVTIAKTSPLPAGAIDALAGELSRRIQYAFPDNEGHVSVRYAAANNLSVIGATGNDSNLLIVFYVQIMPDDFVMQLHRF